MNLSVITGSRADYGLLEWPLKLLREDPFFSVAEVILWGMSAAQAMQAMDKYLTHAEPDMVLLLGDRFEIMAAAMAAHLHRIKIAHIGGGDVTEGSYDDAMRDCISRFAYIHFVTSTNALARLSNKGYCNVRLVGNPGIDYIRNAPWKKERPIAEPYVVVSYQAETIDGTNEIMEIFKTLPYEKHWVFIKPNIDLGSAEISKLIDEWCIGGHRNNVYDSIPHAEFLNLLYHCDEFIGNSSAILYEAPFFDPPVKTRLIGKRQRGRVVPLGDGKASQRIIDTLKNKRLDWGG